MKRLENERIGDIFRYEGKTYISIKRLAEGAREWIPCTLIYYEIHKVKCVETGDLFRALIINDTISELDPIGA